MMLNVALKVAGAGLLLIVLANVLAFEKLGWNRNLKKAELFFGQVFKVHTLFIVMTMLAMAAMCLFTTEEMMESESVIVRGTVWFLAIFWSVRLVLSVCYYDKTLMRENPWWAALFTGAFSYLAGVFITTAIV